MAMFYAIIVAIIVAVKGCDDDTFLIPERLEGDTSMGALDNLLDGSYTTFWRGDNDGGEYVYFYYPSEVEVKWMYVQKWDDDATYFEVYDGARTIAYGNLGDTTEQLSSVTLLFNDVYTDMLRFYFYREGNGGNVPAIARAEVHGCYTVLSSFPSISPTSSPTVPPTIVYTANDSFQVKLGAIEFFSIVFLCLCLCGVVLFLFLSYRRDRRALLAAYTLNHNEDHVKVVQTGNALFGEEDGIQDTL